MLDGCCETSGQYLDFSESPNIREVRFGVVVGLRARGVSWVPLALSTLRPATSPRLSAIRLDFAGSPIDVQPTKTLFEDFGGRKRGCPDRS